MTDSLGVTFDHPPVDLLWLSIRDGVRLFARGKGGQPSVRIGHHGPTARTRWRYLVQACGALRLIEAALMEAGANLRHVVRTVVYVTDLADVAHVSRAHAEVFGSIRPASTLVQVSALTPALARVEIEVTAVISPI